MSKLKEGDTVYIIGVVQSLITAHRQVARVYTNGPTDHEDSFLIYTDQIAFSKSPEEIAAECAV